MILLTDEETKGLERMVLQEVTHPLSNTTQWEWVSEKLTGLARDKAIARAQLKKVSNSIQVVLDSEWVSDVKVALIETLQQSLLDEVA